MGLSAYTLRKGSTISKCQYSNFLITGLWAVNNYDDPSGTSLKSLFEIIFVKRIFQTENFFERKEYYTQ